mmetsp:Transcript_40713/g.79705  ORF Transcript_40713/g.79705 Transcript_40713/m.79705 type:complete len:141 (+) Transcript_40713:24-446(+)
MDARTGVWQLRRLVVSYCKHSGSSRGVRSFIEEKLPALQERYPHLQVETTLRSGKHPHLEGFYKNGVNKPIGVKNTEPERIHEYAEFLIQQWGSKYSGVSSQGHKTRTKQQSVQGIWTPFLNRPKLDAETLKNMPPPERA